MPDRDVITIRDVIYFQYAKLIARSAHKLPDGHAVKAKCYGFVKKTFRDLQSGRKRWSDILREDRQLVEAPKACLYCGATDNLTWEHIVPRSLKINDRCATCDVIQGIHNQVWCCAACNSRKGARGLYSFYREILPEKPKFYDYIPALAEKKYLKTVYSCCDCAKALDQGDIDGDGVLTVMDVEEVGKRHLKG